MSGRAWEVGGMSFEGGGVGMLERMEGPGCSGRGRGGCAICSCRWCRQGAKAHRLGLGARCWAPGPDPHLPSSSSLPIVLLL